MSVVMYAQLTTIFFLFLNDKFTSKVNNQQHDRKSK